MSDPRVSVVLPVRNGVPYLREAVESVLTQTYADLELVVLENSSSDGTVDILAGFGDPRLRVVPSERTLTMVENWARAIEQARGEWTTFLGHDDVFYPGFLEEMISLVGANPQATVFHSHFDVIDGSGVVLRTCRPPTRQSADDLAVRAFRSEQFVTGTGYLVRTDHFRKVGGFPAHPGLLHSDVVCWYRIASLGYLACSPKTLIGYRIHGANTHLTLSYRDDYAAARVFIDFFADTAALRDDPQRTRQLKVEHYQSLRRAAARRFAETGDSTAFATARSELDEVAEAEGFTLKPDTVASLLERIGRMRLAGLRRSLLAAGRAVRPRDDGSPGHAP